MTWLSDLLPPRVFKASVEVLPNVRELNLGAGLIATYNATTKQIDITLDVAAAGYVTGAAASVEGEVLVATGLTGKALTRSSVKFIDAGPDTPAILPRIAGKGMYLLGASAAVGSGADGGAVVIRGGQGDGAGKNGDIALSPGPNPNRGVTLLNKESRGDGIASLRGAEGTVVIGAAGTEPGGGTVNDHVQLMGAGGLLRVFGAYGNDPAHVLAKVPTSTVEPNELYIAAGANGEMYGSGVLLTALKFERATDGEDFLELGSLCKFYTDLAIGPLGADVATLGTIRLPQAWNACALLDDGVTNAQLFDWDGDTLYVINPKVGGSLSIQATGVSLSAPGATGTVALTAGGGNEVAVDAGTDVTRVGGATGVALMAFGSNIVTIATDGASQFGVRLTDHGLAYAMAVGALTP